MRRWPMRLAAPLVSGAAFACMRRNSVELVLEHELGRGALAELLAQLEERAVADLLADGDARRRDPLYPWSW